MWTHIVGVLYVDTGMRDKNIADTVKHMLERAPKITGSEGDADVFVNVLSGCSIWTNCDCEGCQYGCTIKHFDDGFECDAPEDFKCPDGEYQSRVVITVVGDLRDRTRERTLAEWDAFARFVEAKNGCGFWIRNQAYHITT
jgi:hypothetical protein